MFLGVGAALSGGTCLCGTSVAVAQSVVPPANAQVPIAQSVGSSTAASGPSSAAASPSWTWELSGGVGIGGLGVTRAAATMIAFSLGRWIGPSAFVVGRVGLTTFYQEAAWSVFYGAPMLMLRPRGQRWWAGAGAGYGRIEFARLHALAAPVAVGRVGFDVRQTRQMSMAVSIDAQALLIDQLPTANVVLALSLQIF